MNVVLCGDFNCHPGSRFYDLYAQLCTDLNVVQSDVNRLQDSFTYCNDSGTITSWIDHFLCSKAIDDLIDSLNILDSYITSDNKPLLMSLCNTCDSGTPVSNSTSVNDDSGMGTFLTDWKHCDEYDLTRCHYALDEELCKIDIPTVLFELHCGHVAVSDSVKQLIDTYYQ